MSTNYRKNEARGEVRPKNGSFCGSNNERFNPFNSILRRMAADLQPEKKEKKVGKPKTLLTDEQVLEFRARYEFDGERLVDLAKAYGVRYDYACSLARYATRSKLFPVPRKK